MLHKHFVALLLLSLLLLLLVLTLIMENGDRNT